MTATQEESQTTGPSDSETKEEVPHYWLRMPAKRDNRHSPTQMVASILPESQDYDKTCLEEETNAGRLGQEAGHETEVRSGMPSEDRLGVRQQLSENQSWCNEDLQMPQMTYPEVRPSTPQGVPHPFLRQSTRKRRPAHVFTDPSFGRPTYEPHPTVGAIEAQPLQCLRLVPPTIVSVSYSGCTRNPTPILSHSLVLR